MECSSLDLSNVKVLADPYRLQPYSQIFDKDEKRTSLIYTCKSDKEISVVVLTPGVPLL